MWPAWMNWLSRGYQKLGRAIELLFGGLLLADPRDVPDVDPPVCAGGAEDQGVLRTPLDLVDRVFVAGEGLEAVFGLPPVPHDDVPVLAGSQVDVVLARVEVDGVDLGFGGCDFEHGGLRAEVPAGVTGSYCTIMPVLLTLAKRFSLSLLQATSWMIWPSWRYSQRGDTEYSEVWIPPHTSTLLSSAPETT